MIQISVEPWWHARLYRSTLRHSVYSAHECRQQRNTLLTFASVFGSIAIVGVNELYLFCCHTKRDSNIHIFMDILSISNSQSS